MISISFGLAYIGFVLLSVSLKRHYLQAFPVNGNFLRWRLANRIVGYSLVILSILPAMKLNGSGVGFVEWFSILAAAAFLQAMLLSYWPKRSLLFSGAGMALIVIGLIS